MTETQFTVRNAVLLGAGTLFSRLLGLGRDMLFAYILGAGLVADMFLAAFRVPNFFRRLLSEGGLSLSFIPIFRKTALHEGAPAAFSFGRAAMLELALLALLPVLLFLYGSSAVASALMPGYAESAEVTGGVARLARITIFYLPLGVAAALMFGMLVAIRRFVVPAFGPAVINLGFMVSAGYILSVGATGYEAALLLCAGLLFGAALHLVLPLADLVRQGYRPFGRVDHRAAPVRAFLRSLPPSALGSSFYQTAALLAMLLASFAGPGQISALYFAERLLELPLALIGVSLSTAGLGRFTTLSLEEQYDELSLEIGAMLSLCFFLTLPAAVGLAVFALPLADGIFGHGAFGPEAVSMTAVALVFYVPALPAVAGARPLLAALNARGRAAPTVGAALCALGVMLAACALLLPAYGPAGIVMGLSLASWCNFSLLALALKKDCASGFMPWRGLAVYTGLSLLMGALAWVAVELCARYLVDGLGPYARLAVGIPVGLGCYLCLAFLVRSEELALLRRALGLKN